MKTLEDARLKANWSQYGLAKLTGLSKATIWLIETGRVQPSKRSRRIIEDAVGPVDWDATYATNKENRPDERLFAAIRKFVERDDDANQQEERLSLVNAFISSCAQNIELRKLKERKKKHGF